MATLYKPTIVTYQLKDGSHRTPDGKRVTKTTPGATRQIRQSKKWYGRYTDGAGRPMRVPLSESKETARRMLAKLSGDAQLVGVGLGDPFQDHRARPLAEHLEDYRRYSIADGNTPKYVAKSCKRIQSICDGCRFLFPDDIQAARLVEFLAELRRQGTARVPLEDGIEAYTRAEVAEVLGINKASVARILRRLRLSGQGNGKARRYSKDVVLLLQDRLSSGIGISTCNHYLIAVKSFTRWLARERRIPADPLSHLERQNPEVDRRRSRRALREEQFQQFIEATGKGDSFRGLTGPDRLVLYTVAANTGFRVGELASLSPASFDLDGDGPSVTVQAAYSKRRRKDHQPLKRDLAALLRSYLAGKPAGKPVWPGTWKGVAAEMLRRDLARAKIPYEDDQGRVFDFHAMRGQFISLLAARGVHPKVAQELARHSTITLTMDYYTHLDLLDVAGALEQLPPVAAGPNPAAKGKARARRFLSSSLSGSEAAKGKAVRA
jgi:integrase